MSRKTMAGAKGAVPPELLCSAFGHSFVPVTIDRGDRRKPGFGKRVEYACTRGCGTVRVELIDYHGRLGARWYVWTDDYKEFGAAWREGARRGRAETRRQYFRHRAFAAIEEE